MVTVAGDQKLPKMTYENMELKFAPSIGRNVLFLIVWTADTWWSTKVGTTSVKEKKIEFITLCPLKL